MILLLSSQIYSSRLPQLVAVTILIDLVNYTLRGIASIVIEITGSVGSALRDSVLWVEMLAHIF
jgi:hypothetical protein